MPTSNIYIYIYIYICKERKSAINKTKWVQWEGRWVLLMAHHSYGMNISKCRNEYFFQANEIEGADKKKAVLLSGVGVSTYSLLRSFLCPEKPGDKTYNELVSVLKSHYNPKPSEIVQRFKLNSRTWKDGETVADYVAELKKLAQHCEYGATLPQMLRDRLVCGVKDDRMQRRLISEVWS